MILWMVSVQDTNDGQWKYGQKLELKTDIVVENMWNHVLLSQIHWSVHFFTKVKYGQWRMLRNVTVLDHAW